MTMRELETKRLWLRPTRLEDAAQVQPLFSQWAVVAYLNEKVPWPYPENGAEEHFRKLLLPAVERGEQWHWTVRTKEEPERVIGAIGLMRSLTRSEQEANRGFWLDPEWQGRGLMTEAVVAANDFWFGELGFAVLRAPKAVGNQASRRVSEKTGMRVVARYRSGYVSGEHETEMWEITSEEWRAWRAAHPDA